MRAAFAAALVGLLLLTGASPWAADPMVLALVLLALAAAALTVVGGPGLTLGLGVLPSTHGRGHVPMRRDLPTDPTHHPLAPRAPGLV